MSRLLLFAGLLCAAAGTHAATLCRLVSTPGLAFGAYDTLSPVPTDTLTNIRITCERNGGPQKITLTMAVGAGANAVAVQARRMRQVGGIGEFLAYGIYRDVGRSSAWGVTNGVDTVSQDLAVPNFGTESAVFTLYGRIPALQDVSAGTYGDGVEITVTP